jgi:hypothetical protein
MKTRQGFVSNSSSSSFVVAFPRKIKSAKEMKQLLYGDMETVEEYGYSKPAYELAQQVYKDYKVNHHITNVEEMIDYVAGTGQLEIPRYMEPTRTWETSIHHGTPEWEEAYDSWWDQLAKIEEAYAVKFWDENKDKEIVCFEYSDNGEGIEGCLLEHAGTFDQLSHLTISTH